MIRRNGDRKEEVKNGPEEIHSCRRRGKKRTRRKTLAGKEEEEGREQSEEEVEVCGRRDSFEMKSLWKQARREVRQHWFIV